MLVLFIYDVCQKGGGNFARLVRTGKEGLLDVLDNLGLSVLETLLSTTLTEFDLLHWCLHSKKVCCFFSCFVF